MRLGTAAGTTRGMDTETFTLIGNLIADVLDAAAATGEPDSAVVERVKAQVRDICQRYPTYSYRRVVGMPGGGKKDRNAYDGLVEA